MESCRSVLSRAAGEASAAADPDLEASAGAVKEKKNRASSGERVFILVSEGPQAAVTETTSAWTGQKKTKIRSTVTSAEHSSGKIVGGQEQDLEEIDCLDWDDDKLEKEIDGCYLLLKDDPFVHYGGAIDDESFKFHDEKQLRVLNERLALCRIRAHEIMDYNTLSEAFPSKDLEDNEYYLHYERSFEWYFDPVYCQYVDFEDYQRLMLRNNGEYEDWEYYRRTCSTLEVDQEYVQFWEKLTNKSELIDWYVTRSTYELRIERLFYYHTMKIAALHPSVYKHLVDTGCIEFRHRLLIDFIWSRPCADFLLEMWKLLKGDKLSFEDALLHVYNNDKHFFMFAIKAEFEPNLRPLEMKYKPFLDRIRDEVAEDAEKLINDYVTGKARKPKTYYDYAKKKLAIAEKIGLIQSPSTKAPCDKAVHGHTVKQGIGSKEG